jgi:hypothetical protein
MHVLMMLSPMLCFWRTTLMLCIRNNRRHVRELPWWTFMSPIVRLSITFKISRNFRIWRQFIQHINNWCTLRRFGDPFVTILLECVLLLSELMLPGQPASMTIKVADLASMR